MSAGCSDAMLKVSGPGAPERDLCEDGVPAEGGSSEQRSERREERSERARAGAPGPLAANSVRPWLATEATLGLVNHAFTSPDVTRVIAETLPGLVPSIGVLDRTGFRFIGEGSEPGVVRYERMRSAGK